MNTCETVTALIKFAGPIDLINPMVNKTLVIKAVVTNRQNPSLLAAGELAPFFLARGNLKLSVDSFGDNSRRLVLISYSSLRKWFPCIRETVREMGLKCAW